jgi:hypothetical protein
MIGPVSLESIYTIENFQKEMKLNKNTLSIVLIGLALAMGVAVIVLNIIGLLETKNALTLLGFGLTALAMAALQR